MHLVTRLELVAVALLIVCAGLAASRVCARCAAPVDCARAPWMRRRAAQGLAFTRRRRL
jgi:hypothetical protein